MYPAKPTSTHTDCFFPISVSKCRFGGKIIFAPNLHLLTTASRQTYIYSHVSKCRFDGKIISLPNLHLLTIAMVSSMNIPIYRGIQFCFLIWFLFCHYTHNSDVTTCACFKTTPATINIKNHGPYQTNSP